MKVNIIEGPNTNKVIQDCYHFDTLGIREVNVVKPTYYTYLIIRFANSDLNITSIAFLSNN